MQNIRADDLLRLLRDLSACIGREQLGADGRIQNILQNGGAARKHIVFANAVDHPAHQRFRHARIHAVHAHMVRIIGAPAKRQLAQISRADDKAADPSRIIHQDLRSLPRLRVFKGQIKAVARLTDIGKMLLHGSRDRNFNAGDAERFHQGQGVLIGAVSRAEAGHCDADDILHCPPCAPRRLCADKQRQGGIKPAGNADHGAAAGMLHALFQRHDLHLENIGAALLPIRLAVRHERHFFQRIIGKIIGGRQCLGAHGAHVPAAKRRTLGKGFVFQAVGAQPAEINIGAEHIVRIDRFCVLTQKFPALANNTVPGKNQICGGFRAARGNIHIRAELRGGLHADKAAAIGALCNGFIACGKIENHLCAAQRKRAARGDGCPKILAQLNSEGYIAKAEQKIRAKGHRARLVCLDPELPRAQSIRLQPGGRREPAMLIKFRISRQKGLRHNAKHLTAAKHRRAAVKRAAHRKGQPDQNRRGKLRRLRKQKREPLLHALQQRLLKKQIAAGISAQGKLRKNDDLRALFVRFFCHIQNLRRICFHISDRKGRNGSGDSQKIKHGASLWKLQALFVSIPHFFG